MTASTQAAVDRKSRSTSGFSHKKLNFFGVIGSEFLKFRTLTTNWVMSIIVVLLMVGLALAFASSLNLYLEALKEQAAAQAGQRGGDFGDMTLDSINNYALHLGASGVSLASMLVGSLAVVFIGSEYATRSIQSTITAVPKRSLVFLAKLLTLSFYSFVLGFILAAASYRLGTLILDQEIRDSAPFGDTVVYSWLAVAIYFMLMAWMGFGFGSLIRNNAGGIVCVVICMFILPIILGLLGLGIEWIKDFQPYLPSALGDVMTGFEQGSDDIGQKEAGLWFGLWAAVPALLGYLRFRFTDSK